MTLKKIMRSWPLIGLLAGLISCLWLFSTLSESGLFNILSGPAGILGGLIGAAIGAAIGNAIGKKNNVVLIGICAIVCAIASAELARYLVIVVVFKGGLY